MPQRIYACNCNVLLNYVKEINLKKKSKIKITKITKIKKKILKLATSREKSVDRETALVLLLFELYSTILFANINWILALVYM